jgi:hypothetical protein
VVVVFVLRCLDATDSPLYRSRIFGTFFEISVPKTRLKYRQRHLSFKQVSIRIVVSTPACHAGNLGSIPRSRDTAYFFWFFWFFLFNLVCPPFFAISYCF